MDDTTKRMARLRLRLRWLVVGSVVALVLVVGWFAYGAIVQSAAMMTGAAGGFAAVVTGWSSAHAAIRTRLDVIAVHGEE